MAINIRVSCGVEYLHLYEISTALQESGRAGYDFISVPLFHQQFQREVIDGKAKSRCGPFTRADLLLASSDWNSLVVARITPSICTLVESDIPAIRFANEALLHQELSYASHLGIPAIIVPLNSPRFLNLARILHNKCLSGVSFQVWVRVKLQALSCVSCNYRNDMPTSSSCQKTDTWQWWNRFQSMTNTERKIAIALEITADLPDDDILKRWLGERVRCVILPASVFLTNKKGFPVLSRAHQVLIKKLFRLHVQFIICGPMRHSHVKLYQQYLDHILRVDTEEDSNMQVTRGYEDVLQCPLQPLMDNLESQTYEVFERDSVKYIEYERALICALRDKTYQKEHATHGLEFLRDDDIKNARISSSIEKNTYNKIVNSETENCGEIISQNENPQPRQRKLVVMVLGAGRGPLVRKSLSAAQIVGAKIKIYAVDKNPNAVVTLEAQKDENWGDSVTVVSSDMRDWKPPEKADIIVSELLGSFGDNELSPECLDGAQKFLKDDGIIIPSSYTSYICPIQSAKLYNEVRFNREKDKHFLAHFETPYVVYLHNKHELAQPQPLFTFRHPNKDKIIDNRRYKNVHFRINTDSVVHAIAGYFECTLYKHVKLSIVPNSHSPGMYSWFPMLFPFKEPIPVKSGEILEISFWRCGNDKKVWYEWISTSPTVTSIHNPNGRAYTIGL